MSTKVKTTKNADKIVERTRVKLTEKQQAHLARDIKEGKLTQMQLAEKYGVSHGYVWFRTKSGKTYNERVNEHGGPLRVEKKSGKMAKVGNKKESALAKLKNKK